MDGPGNRRGRSRPPATHSRVGRARGRARPGRRPGAWPPTAYPCSQRWARRSTVLTADDYTPTAPSARSNAAAIGQGVTRHRIRVARRSRLRRDRCQRPRGRRGGHRGRQLLDYRGADASRRAIGRPPRAQLGDRRLRRRRQAGRTKDGTSRELAERLSAIRAPRSRDRDRRHRRASSTAGGDGRDHPDPQLAAARLQPLDRGRVRPANERLMIRHERRLERGTLPVAPCWRRPRKRTGRPEPQASTPCCWSPDQRSRRPSRSRSSSGRPGRAARASPAARVMPLSAVTTSAVDVGAQDAGLRPPRPAAPPSPR